MKPSRGERALADSRDPTEHDEAGSAIASSVQSTDLLLAVGEVTRDPRQLTQLRDRNRHDRGVVMDTAGNRAGLHGQPAHVG